MSTLFFVKAVNKTTGESSYHHHDRKDGQHYLKKLSEATHLNLEDAQTLKESYEQSHVLGNLHTWQIVKAN